MTYDEEYQMIMDRIREFDFREYEPAQGVEELILRLHEEGTNILLDGWSPRLKGKAQPPEVLEQVKALKMPIIARLITLCPHPCESCWGWGVKFGTLKTGITGLEEMHWFCSAHYPDTHEKMELWKTAQNYLELGRRCTECLDREDYTGFAEWNHQYGALGEELRERYRSLEPNYPSTL